ncbi:MAG: tRNA (adenosine(37)-N6)-threonylcarbamoyltransferase complex dimerization subunit type 1 TsaB, partial [Gemmataceae bacterium]
MGDFRLLLETSSRAPLAALADGDAVVASRRLEEGRRNARDLVPAVAKLLRERGLVPRDLAGIVVGLGPGSYTGLRVGVMTAKTLAYAVGCPLVGVPTFHVLARQAEEERVEVIADAQKDAVYHQAFEGGRPASDLTIVRVGDWLAGRDPSVLVTGPGLAKVSAEVRRARESVWMPSPDALLEVGLAAP